MRAKEGTAELLVPERVESREVRVRWMEEVARDSVDVA